MRTWLLLLFIMILQIPCYAAKLKGRVTDEKGEPLPFASVYIKGTTKGSTSNLDGYYSYEIPQGVYTIICQYIGFQKQEVELNVPEEQVTKNFTLVSRGKELKQVVIKKGEDPAYRIIRKTIKKRSDYNKLIDAYKANAYIKGSFKLNEISSSQMLMSLMGVSKKDTVSQKEMEDSKGILMLTESYNEIAYKRPDKLKITVKSSRVSGNRNAYGFSQPLFVNMYDNNVTISDQLSPRGFISPIAETAMLNYKYELLDTYQEDGKTISIIKVIPRRKFEPLFAGKIEVIENEWRLHSVDLIADKNHQLEILDTVQIKQLFVPVNDILMVKDQSFKMKFKLMGFGLSGNFVNVFTDYVFDYDTKKTFNKYIQVFEDSALKHDRAYWDRLRPVPLDSEEVADYIKKDSIEVAEKSKKDTIIPSKNRLKSILLNGIVKKLKHDQSISTSPVLGLNQINWNTVEGFNYQYGVRYNKKLAKEKNLKASLKMRYGVSNRQFNSKLTVNYQSGRTNLSNVRISGGRYVFQYNQSEPVNPLINSFYTLFYGENYLKLFQGWFGDLKFTRKYINGLTYSVQVSYQDRMPLRNSTLYSFRNSAHTSFTENYPVELLQQIEPRHQALIASISMSYQPGRKFIKYPDRLVATHSDYPTFSGEYSKGLNILGSDVDYDRWKLSMDDEMRLNLWGTFMYRATIGGFIRNNYSYSPDYTHFNGNRIILASPYLNSFQLSPYYANSNTNSFYTTINAEHHFYGLLTNKIPLFRRLKWYLVASSNAYYVNRDNNYIEVSAGLENIGYKMLRFIRVDGVVGYTNGINPVYGIRIGLNSSIVKLDVGNDD